jgi:hypothetical protein
LDEKSDRLEDPDIDGGTGVAHCNTVCTMRQERKHAEEEGSRKKDGNRVQTRKEKLTLQNGRK